MNIVIVIGNLGRNPESKEAASGMVTKFSIATSRKYKDETQTEWHNIVVFGKLAEVCDKYLAKGKKVCVVGRLQTSSWEGKDGATKYRTEVIANEIEFLDPKDKTSTEEATVNQEANGSSDEADDLPF